MAYSKILLVHLIGLDVWDENQCNKGRYQRQTRSNVENTLLVSELPQPVATV
jgi:hypothetical protein